MDASRHFLGAQSCVAAFDDIANGSGRFTCSPVAAAAAAAIEMSTTNRSFFVCLPACAPAIHLTDDF